MGAGINSGVGVGVGTHIAVVVQLQVNIVLIDPYSSYPPKKVCDLGRHFIK